MNEDLSYPVGRFEWDGDTSAARRGQLIGQIADAPRLLRRAVEGLSDEQLDTPYRPGGWTVRQVAHHVPDSHMNGFTRVKLALTEDVPTIKPYDEARFAQLGDVRSTLVEVSLALLDALHARWAALFRSMSDEDFAREFRHPELGAVSLDKQLALYAWHGRHHAAHVARLRERMGW
ncbi:MAG: putative metal-dependent hydrolase [Acidobacteriota bacterium]|nr:putative metal-dependent hydrolase [Acidobacteriota bacterium]